MSIKTILWWLTPIALMVFVIYIILIFDPFSWGTVRSSKFTWEKFDNVKEGQAIDSVVALLGPPVRPPEDFSMLTDDPGDVCVSGGCRKYIFAGADLGVSFKEAIVIAGPDGRIVSTQIRQEN